VAESVTGLFLGSLRLVIGGVIEVVAVVGALRRGLRTSHVHRH